MKNKWLICIFMLLSIDATSQNIHLPNAYMRDSFPVLVQQCRELLDHAYMADSLLAVTDSLPGWEGFPVKLYEYKTGNDIYTHHPKIARVYLLNPSPEKLAMWIVTTCWVVKKSLDYRYTHAVFQQARLQSGAQFPVKGLVYEDQNIAGYYEPYVFKDGVTVYLKDSSWLPADKICTPAQISYYLQLTNEEIKPQTGQYARIVSTTREDYTAAGGKAAVGTKNNRTIAWLDVVRNLYQNAMHSDFNELMIDWAKSHLHPVHNR